LGNLVNGDTLSGSVTRTAGESVGKYSINQGLLTATSNYTLTYVNDSLEITPRTITVNATAKTKVYGDANPALTYTYTGTLKSGDSFSGSLSRAAGDSVGTYVIGQGNLSLSGNYTLVFDTALFTVTPRPITVTADGKSKVYNDADPTLTYRISSGNLVNGDTLSGSVTRTAGESVGKYSINQGLLTATSNYTL
jgi:hypothetical protein